MKRAVGLCLALFALIVAAQDNISSQDRYHEEKPPEGLQCAVCDRRESLIPGNQWYYTDSSIENRPLVDYGSS